jgi:hypothetical protein
LTEKELFYCGKIGSGQKLPLLSSKILLESIFTLAHMEVGKYQG